MRRASSSSGFLFSSSIVYVPLSLWSSSASPSAFPALRPTTEASSLGLVGLPVASPVLAELRPILWSSDLCLRRTRAAVGAPAVTVAGIGAGTLPRLAKVQPLENQRHAQSTFHRGSESRDKSLL